MEEDDEASKSIRQLGLISLVSEMDRKVMEEATTRLMEHIIRSDNSLHKGKF